MDPTNLTPAGDQYSLGCVLYHMLTGTFPFPDGSAAEKMMAHQFKEPTPISELNPDVPAELSAVVCRLMKKCPAERYGSVTEVQVALQPLAQATSFAPQPKPRSLPGREANRQSHAAHGTRRAPLTLEVPSADAGTEDIGKRLDADAETAGARVIANPKLFERRYAAAAARPCLRNRAQTEPVGTCRCGGSRR